MRKKEILIIILIIALTIGIGFSSNIIDYFKKNDETEEKEKDNTKFIILSFKGELIQEVDFKLNKGVSFGYVYQFLNNYLNSYSIIDIDFNETFNESKTITIKSNDIKTISEEEIDLTDKICINRALQKELTNLYGIGDKRALRIIEYRKNKKIESFDELKQLIEVSDYVIEQIKKEAYL